MTTQWNIISQFSKNEVRMITPITGITTNNYVNIVDLDVRWLSDTTITISNEGGTNEMDYKVIVYNSYTDGVGYTTSTNTIAINDEVQIVLNRHARIKIQVKSTIADSHTNYQIDVISGR